MNKFVVKLVSVFLVLVFAAGAFVPAVKAAQPATSGNTIVDVALAANAATGEFSILIAALKAADPKILAKLSSERTYTVFAPTDAAFVALLDELGLTAGELLSNRNLVTKVLLYHIVRGSYDSSKVLAMSQIKTLRGFLYQNGGVLTDYNGRTSNIIAVDIAASNGYIHVIDRVVLPNLSK